MVLCGISSEVATHGGISTKWYMEKNMELNGQSLKSSREVNLHSLWNHRNFKEVSSLDDDY